MARSVSLCLMCLNIVGVTCLYFKIGILVDERYMYNLTQTSTVYLKVGRQNVTVDILWRQTRDNCLFCNSQAALSLVGQGANVVFDVNGVTRTTALESDGFDSVLPLSGIGDLPGIYQETGLSTPGCDTVHYNDHLLLSEVDTALPEYYDYTTIVKATMNKLKWTNAILVYDKETEHLIDNFPEFLNPDDMFLTMYKKTSTDTADDHHDFLHDVYKNITKETKELHVVIFSGTETMMNLMQAAENFDVRNNNLTSLYYNSLWLIFHVGSNSDGHLDFVSDLFNVAIVTLPPCQPPSIPSYLTLHYMLNKISSRNDLLKKYTKRESSCSLETGFAEDVSFLWSQIRNKYVQSIRFPIETLMFRPQNRSLAIIGYASLGGRVDMISKIFPNVDYGLNGKMLTVVSDEYYPFTYKLNGKWTGLCIEIVDELKRTLNFTYRLTFPKDGEYGRLVNGSWTGMVGELIRREVDIVAAALFIVEERIKVMDFTLAFFWDASVIFMKKPDPKDTQWMRILEPLQWKVIILTIGLVPFVTLLMTCVETLSPDETSVQTFEGARFYNNFFYAFGSIFQEGSTMDQKSLTSRIVVFCWWILCIILGATYCGNLIANLAVNKETPPFNSLATMVEQDEYQWGTLGGTFWVTWFELSDDPVQRKVWAGIKEFNKTDPRVLSQSWKQHESKLKEGKYAYIAERSLPTSCEFQVAEEEFFPLQYGIGLPLNSPLTEKFSEKVTQMHENGLMKIWEQNHWPDRCVSSSGTVVNEAKPITWLDVQLAFGSLGTGMVIGSLVLLVENCVSRMKRQNVLGNHQHTASDGNKCSIEEAVDETTPSFDS